MARKNTLLIGLVVAFLLSSWSRPQTASSPAAQTTPAPSAQKDQQPATVYEPATVLRATTRLVVLDVVATDKKGNAVTDLERGDFKVEEDGNEQQIRVFSFQQPAVRTAAAAPQPAFNLPPNVFTNVPRYSGTSALNVVLLDGLNTTVPHQAYVRDQMIHYLEKMPEGEPVAIYMLSSKLTLLQDFTTDPAVLREVVKRLKGKVSPLLDNPAGGPEAELLPAGLADSGMVPDQMMQSMMRFEQERTSFQTDLRVNYTLAALTSIARALSGYAGRKNLIWISEAFPLNVDPNMELTNDIFAGTRNYGAETAAAAETLIDAQVAIYPIDARGLMAPSVFDASSTGRDKFGRSMGADPRRMQTAISNENAQLQAAHSTMQDMAERTGGKAFYNRNDIDGAIRRSIDDGSTYYTLAYYPTNKDWNGKFRKIHLSVDRPGVKLRHRLGYYAVDPKVFVEQNKRQQATLFGEALSLDSPVSTGLKFQAEVVPPSEKTQSDVLVQFSLDPQAITFDTQGDGLQHAVVDCVVQAYTEKGKFIKTTASTVNASLKPDTYTRVMRGGFPCKQTIALPAGKYVLRLGVRDDRTGLVGTANAKVTVTAAAGNDAEVKKP